ncbi:MAG: UDP-N-acetylmuramoyl-L-alanine--D-glutamate ligase [Verrucomicrobiales bacterium]|nr:UDP-N-acetylmuramoyl-L-alanine--D-glutamate ligase [Verrucomicrobiales bacterium]
MDHFHRLCDDWPDDLEASLNMNLSGKHIAVLGAGGSGIAAASLALHCGAHVAAFDSGDAGKLAPAVEKFADKGIVLTCGDAALSPERRYDLAVISPGIDAASPIGKVFQAASDELIGEIEFADRLCEVPVIAITGTNGKTTTTSLVTEMLNAAGRKAVAAGNIGKPYSEVVLEGALLDWIVLEVSSFQLETVVDFSPEVAVWMNFAPDHMDRYEGIEDYRAAKLRLFERIDESKLVISKYEDGLSFPDQITFSAFADAADLGYSEGKVIHRASSREFDFSAGQLHGKHNAENVMVALAVADRLGLGWDEVTSSVNAFDAPGHRCEKVGVVGGVTFINDSKSTNLHSLESALAGEERPVILIVGGKDKGLDFSSLNDLVSSRVREAVCIGEIADEISDQWSGLIPCWTAVDVDDAVSKSLSLAVSGEVVLFSPGTSSFDMFRGYEERGEAFREAVAVRATS